MEITIKKAWEIIGEAYNNAYNFIDNDGQRLFIVHKLNHTIECYELAKVFLEAEGLPKEQVEIFLCGVILHDIGNFKEFDKKNWVSGVNHGPAGAKHLRKIGIEDFLLNEVIAQHGVFKVTPTGDKVTDLAIAIVRDADCIANMKWTCESPLDCKRSIYYDKGQADAGIKPGIWDDFNAGRLVNLKKNPVKTVAEGLLFYACWENNLTLESSKKYWKNSGFTETLVNLAKELDKNPRESGNNFSDEEFTEAYVELKNLAETRYTEVYTKEARKSKLKKYA